MPSLFKQLVSLTAKLEQNKPDLRQKIMEDITGFNRPQPKPKEQKGQPTDKAPKKKGWGWGRKQAAADKK